MSGWHDSFGSTPLAIGSARGIREWTVGESGMLIGHYQAAWQGNELTARCGRRSFLPYRRKKCACGREIPCRDCRDGIKCGCGIWAYWRAPRIPSLFGIVTGIIEGTGRTIIGPGGFRTAHAKILALCTEELTRSASYRAGAPRVVMALIGSERPFDDFGPALSARYGVPIFRRRDAMLAEYPTTPEVYTRPQKKQAK